MVNAVLISSSANWKRLSHLFVTAVKKSTKHMVQECSYLFINLKRALLKGFIFKSTQMH